MVKMGTEAEILSWKKMDVKLMMMGNQELNLRRLSRVLYRDLND